MLAKMFAMSYKRLILAVMHVSLARGYNALRTLQLVVRLTLLRDQCFGGLIK